MLHAAFAMTVLSHLPRLRTCRHLGRLVFSRHGRQVLTARRMVSSSAVAIGRWMSCWNDDDVKRKETIKETFVTSDEGGNDPK
mmetsp:Transcript_23332/g.41820  ORF Transcript_23332/g.41820 Transcript_23332/m.41820 type:complete len:83 (-) Transcript_23332:423-671(-)